MEGKRWMILFLTALALVFAAWAGLNLAVDPFGTFGTGLLAWDSYSQTLNPRNAKGIYISEHFDDFDSYIIGSSSAASFLPETLDGYLDARFYNMFHYGADTSYDRELAAWLLENDDVKHLVLVLGLNEANAAGSDGRGPVDRTYYPISGENPVSYYAGYLFASPDFALEKLASRRKDGLLPEPFDVFLPESGVYDKRVRDVESIGSLAAYLEAHGEDFSPVAETELRYVDQCVENVRAIREMCQASDTELTVVLAPVAQEQLSGYSTDSLNRFYEALAAVTPYWNFEISPVSGDERYFYDVTHTRNATANMVLARMYDDPAVYCPEGFGVYCDGVAVTAEAMAAEAEKAGPHSATVPVLLYHHLVEEGEETWMTIHADRFARQMQLLRDNGYHPVPLEALAAYVDSGAPLPDKPVAITFDDGYLSNYTLAYPVLRSYEFPAAIFAIGCSLGHKTYYKDTQYELTPHFGREEIDDMLASGLISVQSHTYDMHQWEPFEDTGPVRDTMLPLEGETEAEYAAALAADIRQQDAAFAEFGLPRSTALAFPQGKYETLTDVVLAAHGYRETFTTDAGRVNTLVCGLPQSLVDLGRYTVGNTVTDEDILAYLSRTAE